ncbi:MAG: NAD(P)H-binding protein [Candidatus Margulisiibacteriota bacterium]
MPVSPKIVLLLGSTGLVGRSVLVQLQQDPKIGEIRCLVRTPTQDLGPKTYVHVVDFNDLTMVSHLFENVTDILCCIGTTIKKAKTKAMFKFVDVEIPLQAARLGVAFGIDSFILISSMGASKTAWSFYLKTKAQIELALQSIGFSRLIIYRPSLLDGNRNEFRCLEAVAIFLFRWCSAFIPSSFQPTIVSKFVKKIQSDLHQLENGIHIIESRMIH